MRSINTMDLGLTGMGYHQITPTPGSWARLWCGTVERNMITSTRDGVQHCLGCQKPVQALLDAYPGRVN